MIPPPKNLTHINFADLIDRLHSINRVNRIACTTSTLDGRMTWEASNDMMEKTMLATLGNSDHHSNDPG